MKKNLYYRTVLQRRNVVKEFILNLFVDSTSFGRLIIEVFIRKNMGRRYFKFSAAIWSAFFLLFVPVFASLIRLSYRMSYDVKFWGLMKEYWLWYIFLILFIYFSYLRYKDVKHLKDVFDFDHFSLSSGEFHPFYKKLTYKGKPFSPRNLEVFIEPLPFFIGGLFLAIIGQGLLGLLFVFSSIVYSISYSRAYSIGDNFILDKIDEIICNEQLNNTFVSDEPTTKGFRFYGEKPQSEEWRKKAYDHFYEGEDEEFPEAE